MKTFNTPKMVLVELAVKNIIATSNNDDSGDNWDGEEAPA